MRHWRRWVSLGLAIGLSGCTTLLNADGKQTVAINSVPAGAAIRVNGTVLGETPAQVRLARAEEATVQLEKAGYEPYREALPKSTDPVFFLNILFIPGFLVDLASKTWQAFPSQVSGELRPVTARR